MRARVNEPLNNPLFLVFAPNDVYCLMTHSVVTAYVTRMLAGLRGDRRGGVILCTG